MSKIKKAIEVIYAEGDLLAASMVEEARKSGHRASGEAEVIYGRRIGGMLGSFRSYGIEDMEINTERLVEGEVEMTAHVYLTIRGDNRATAVAAALDLVQIFDWELKSAGPVSPDISLIHAYQIAKA